MTLRSFLQYARKATLPELLSLEKFRLYETVTPYTMISHERLRSAYELAKSVVQNSIPGAIVGCGIGCGASAAMMAKAAPFRKLWLFDPFDRCHEPGLAGEAKSSLATIEELLFDKLALLRQDVQMIEGRFQESLPKEAPSIGQIALLRLDTNGYESTTLSLDHLFDSVSPGGYVVIDRYGNQEEHQKAVDDFLSSRGLSPRLLPIDETGRYFTIGG